MSLIESHSELYNELVRLLGLRLQKPYVPSKITMLIASAVKFLGKIRQLAGVEKKEFALSAVRKAISDSLNLVEEEKNAAIDLIDRYADQMIDLLVEFAEDTKTFIHKKTRNPRCGMCKSKPKTQNDAVGPGPVAASREIDAGVYQQLKEFLLLKFQRPIAPQKVIVLVAAGTKFIEQFKNLSEPEKKDLVIRAIRDVISESDIVDEELRAVLLDCLDLFADDLIDHLIDFGRHLYLKVKSTKCCC